MSILCAKKSFCASFATQKKGDASQRGLSRHGGWPAPSDDAPGRPGELGASGRKLWGRPGTRRGARARPRGLARDVRRVRADAAAVLAHHERR